ncbi:MAG: DUF1501 domain-containing protein [Planctomycetaceae bacterium]|nr:DUF1501 domain-containing protein [Planctomycetaceae bacterium]
MIPENTNSNTSLTEVTRHGSRRDFFGRTCDGVFGAAVTWLLNQDFFGGASAVAADQHHVVPQDLKPRAPHHEPQARSVIHLFMNGGPSQMDLFDPKPELKRLDGQPYPGNVEDIGNQGTSDIGVMMAGQYEFRRHGESGMWMADVLPQTSQMVDDICLINSMWTDHPNHDNALYKIHSGRLFMGYPTFGAWTVYGLGTENQNLPAYVVLNDPLGPPKNGTRNWTAGFLPPTFQGTPFRPTGSPVLNLTPQYEQPSDVTATARELLGRLDEIHRRKRPNYPDLDARIESYGLAARMQLSAGEALDLSSETLAVQRMYGVGGRWTDSFARRCLLARRLVERGVRFVQIFMEEQPWDSHADLAANHRGACERTDQPVAALLRDLKERGLLDSTLVVWGGEFGRTPTTQKSANGYSGRDHNMQAFTSWMAGGGIKGGTTYGATDEFGHAVVENPVSVHDFHATILHLLGLHHQKLYFTRSGLEERLTGILPPRVIPDILLRPELVRHG